ncbi:MAG TPA: 1-(5-phosphoribosyl)-5-[(5-phosphoribosylamino)methylideneamino] imidazole-4-carboxamide isomerase [Longimicrobiales bacterium]|nr:1-(5-phosphoribosyl)-5-[(5-phosphoribosylamino)methylideneamino] imidazole-4-carboxamide isomerase [Longimicrobiales bacterium]
MILFAAVDLQQGEVVQLVGGQPDSVRVRWKDPLEVARKWQTDGFEALHVIDLDAARGTGSNLHSIRQIIEAVSIPVQVGGGVRDTARARDLLDAGAARIITGTRALEDQSWLHEVACGFPGKVVVAADVRGRNVLTRGWTRQTTSQLEDVLAALNELPLAAVLITDVGREGRMTGIDAELFRLALTRSTHQIFAAGGIGSPADLAVLRRLGAAGAVLGMALYTGAIGPLDLHGARS